MKKYIIASVLLNIAIIAIVMNIVKPNFWEQRISVGFWDWIYLVFIILIIILVKLFTFSEEDQKGLKVNIINLFLTEKLIITLLIIVFLLLFSTGDAGGNKNLSGTEDTPPVILNLEKTIPVDTLKKTDSLKISFPNEINPKKSINDEKKDEVADTKRKVQLPNEEGLADIRLFPLPEDGYIFLGIVKEKDGEKIWITRRPGNPFDVGDVFTEDYPSMKIFIEANRCNIYDDKIINNGHIVAFDTEYRVIQNIQLETRKEGDYNAWLFVELEQ